MPLAFELEICHELGRWHHEFRALDADERLMWKLWIPERRRRERLLDEEAREEAKAKRTRAKRVGG